MKTFLFTWNPKVWDDWDYDDLARKVRRSGGGGTWSCGKSKRPRPGDRFFHLRQGAEPKGIFGSGWITSRPTEHRRFTGERGHYSQYVDVRWDWLVDLRKEGPLTRDRLADGHLAVVNWDTQVSGIEIPSVAAAELEELWRAHVRKPLRPPPAILRDLLDPELAALEGAARRTLRTHRRREWRLRLAKIHEALYRNKGRLVCEVPGCGFDFAATYGAAGIGYAQVHHKLPLGSRANATTTKLEDLAVLCANCHAMVHVGGECRPIESLIPRRRRVA